MKKYLVMLCVVGSFANCKKDSTPEPSPVQLANEKVIKGKWQLVYFIDSIGKKYTSDDPCWADNTLELRDNKTAVISQGTCIESPRKDKDLEFGWKFIGDDVVDMGTDIVKLTINNDSVLQFHRTNKSYLEYKWRR
jgi:hypothetical protein